MKILKYVLLVILFVLAMTQPVHAADIQDALAPKQEEEKIGTVKLEYNEYPQRRYSMDTYVEKDKWSDWAPWNWDDTFTKTWSQFLSGVNSLLWQGVSLTGLWTGQIAEWAFTLELLDVIIDYADELVSAITGIDSSGFKKDGLFYELSRFFLVAAVVWFVYQGMVKRNTTLAIGGLIKTVFLIAIMIIYVVNLSPILHGFKDGTEWASNKILSSASSITDDERDYAGAEGYAHMRNSIFRTMVYQPWLILTFGTMDEKEVQKEYKKDGNRIDDLLSTEDYSEEREKQVEYEAKEQKNINITAKRLETRFGFLIFQGIMNLITAIILLLISGSMIFFSILGVLIAIVGIFAILYSFFPGYSSTIVDWFNKMINPFLVKIALTIIMTLLFSIQTIIHNDLGEGYGYIGSMAIYAIITIGLWFKRHLLINIITRPTANAGMDNNAFQNSVHYKNSINKVKSYASKFTNPLTKKSKPYEDRWTSKMRYNPGVGGINHNHRAYRSQPVNRKDNTKTSPNRDPKPLPYNVKTHDNKSPRKAKMVNQPAKNRSMNLKSAAYYMVKKQAAKSLLKFDESDWKKERKTTPESGGTFKAATKDKAKKIKDHVTERRRKSND